MENPDRIIHEAMELCWHEYKYICPQNDVSNIYQQYKHRCEKCEHEITTTETKPIFKKDFTNWGNLGTVFDWMQGKWGVFEDWILDEHGETYTEGVASLLNENTSTIRDVIAQWITSTRE